MEIDDLYDSSFSPPKEASPQLQHRRLKRLKKTTDIIDAAPSEPNQVDLLAASSVFSELEALERSKTVNKGYSPSRSNSGSFDSDNELGSGLLLPVVDRKEAKRSLDFGAEHDDFDENSVDIGEEPVEGNAVGDSDLNVSAAKKRNYDERNGKNKKKEDKSKGNDVKPKISSSNKRREEKERRAYLQHLHVESQKLLRETSGAAFKPIPIVHKPVGSVLEKIRQRKLEMLKKTSSASVNSFKTPFEGLIRDHDPSDLAQLQPVDKSEEIDGEELGLCCENMKKTSIDETDMDVCKEVPESSSKDGSHHLQMAHDEEQSLLQPRAPIDDTEDLFCNYQNTEDNDEMPHGQQSTLEEPLGPSPLIMQLKFDSALSNDSSSDEEEDNDKENIVPELLHGSTSDGDLLRKFVDDEAVEEDDSDNDIRFQEDEDAEIDDYEDFKDLIATGFEEKNADIEKRNELHQKWLEQQDTFGTDNLLQKLGCGSKVRESTALLEEEDEEDESSGDEAAEDLRQGNLSKGKKKKMRLMIPEMFPDKDECYISDDETERSLAKQRFLIKAEKVETLFPPIQDENSRDIFCLIKKVNTVGVAKKNVKTSFFDKLLIGGNSNSSSKSSFLGRASSHSLPSVNKKATGTARSFIFSRDDSNSRSSIVIPTEDSSEAVMQIETENVLRKKVKSKFSSSQPKTSSSQKTSISMTESVSNPSLLEMLKVGSRQTLTNNGEEEKNMVGLTQTALAAFKIRKRPFKTQGRK